MARCIVPLPEKAPRDRSKHGARALLCGLLFAAAWFAGCANDPTTLTSGLNDPIALTVVGNSLFWIENATNGNGLNPTNASIRSMPITGGVPTTVLAQANLDGNLTSDGTRLYFSYTTGSPNSVIASCNLDGSNVTTLSSAVSTNFNQNALGFSAMNVVNGTLYFRAQNVPDASGAPAIVNVYGMPATGGTPGILSTLPQAPVAASGLSNYYFADATGVYFTWIEVTVTGTSTFHFSTIPLSGGAPTDFEAIPAANVGSTPIPVEGSVTEVNGTVYFLTPGSSDATSLFSVSAAGGTPTMLSSFSQQVSNTIVGDANGLFIDNSVQSHNPGIFAVTLSGSESVFYADQHTLSLTEGNSRTQVIDAHNVYWVTGGHNGGQGAIHVKARSAP